MGAHVMNAKQELREGSALLRDLMESATVGIAPPWMDSPCEFIRVYSWRESSFEPDIQTKEAPPAS